jgi:glucosamine-phosphate N-acetyltransferase
VALSDGDSGPLLACGTLVLERKLIRNCGTCGHVEDVVVDASARGRGVGRLLLDALTGLARHHGCYKVILDCSEDNTAFYQKCGFRRKEVQMALYF